MIHDIRATAKSTYGQSTSDDFTKTGKIWTDAITLLSPSSSNAESGHHLVDDKEGPVLPAEVPEALEIASCRRNAAHVAGNRLQNDGCYIS